MSRDAIHWGRGLEYLTIGWNKLETAVSVGAGMFAGNAALLGFGIDSLIESLFGLAQVTLLRESVCWWQRTYVHFLAKVFTTFCQSHRTVAARLASVSWTPKMADVCGPIFGEQAGVCRRHHRTVNQAKPGTLSAFWRATGSSPVVLPTIGQAATPYVDCQRCLRNPLRVRNQAYS